MSQTPKPLVSISIPTLNSARTLERTLESIRAQTYRNTETVVIDGGSTDDTLDIAHRQSVRVVHCSRPLLAARLEGIRQSRGEYLGLIDSDQVLAQDCIERAVGELGRFDMVCLGEGTLHPDRWLARLLQLSRDQVQSNLKAYLNPWSGLLIPRMFRASLLQRAIESIPPASIDFVTDRDHQILFLECYRLSRSVSFLPDAVWHDDLYSVIDLLRKAGHWGWGAGLLKGRGLYPELLNTRYQFRRPNQEGSAPFRTEPWDIIGANAVAVLKGIPYEFWFQLGTIRGLLLNHGQK